MIGDVVGGIWKRLPRGLRLRVIRNTQTKFTASVGVIVTNPEGEVLLLDHFLRPSSGWGIPGGFIDPGEQPETAARRELEEETGIALTDIELIGIRTILRHIEIIFRAKTEDSPEVKSREIRALGWFRPDNMPAEFSPAQKRLVERVLNGEFD